MKRGFSLVELSIVLVILGLLVGGVLAGQSLIKASELRKFLADTSKYQTAVNAFRDKYFALPGDFSQATRVWGDHATNCADAAVTDGTPGTCSGDANGFIEGSGATYESFWVWQHLAGAGLVEGQYTGARIQNGGVFYMIPGQNAGAGPRQAIYWIGRPDQNLRTHMYANDFSYNALFIGRVWNGGGANYLFPSGGVVRPEDAWNMDGKMDDGMASAGKFMARNSAANATNDCVDAATGTGAIAAVYGSANYVLASAVEGCMLTIKF